MKKFALYLVAIVLFASCSAPKYSYHFDHYDYNAGKRKSESNQLVSAQNQQEEEIIINEEPLKLSEETLVASADDNQVFVIESKPVEVPKSYKEMTKSEKKEFRKDAQKLMKTYIKAKKSGDDEAAAEAAKAMDKDLRFAAIFGAVGIVSLLIGGDVFYIIGAIALIIGVVFFVMWLTRQ
jgi:hypothetical protein